jgi:hypothetical protein
LVLLLAGAQAEAAVAVTAFKAAAAATVDAVVHVASWVKTEATGMRFVTLTSPSRVSMDKLLLLLLLLLVLFS